MKLSPIISMLRTFQGAAPRVAPSAYVDPAATVIGDVTIGERSSVWPSASLRGDISPIRIGQETSIQDGTVIHTDSGFPTTIGDRVTVGHMAMLHGCTVEDESLIGIGAIVLNGARIGKGAIVAAGALVPEGAEIPEGMLAMGVPAKPRRPVSELEQARFRQNVKNYVERARAYLEEK
ncbi:MAG TPA: gamma carbonic anhydrase family protein [Bryobacteraceae bacterium]|nr:gamma carbonic anhydrase family protein [Bryobacteraceae bacterium]